jgi:hypothetical protein
MTAAEVYAVVQELRAADYNAVGQSFFDERVARMEAGGWVLGLQPYSSKVYRGRRGKTLRHPKNEWRVVAHWYNHTTNERVFYWDNSAGSMFYARHQASTKPAPPKAMYFRTYTVDTNRI